MEQPTGTPTDMTEANLAKLKEDKSSPILPEQLPSWGQGGRVAYNYITNYTYPETHKAPTAALCVLKKTQNPMFNNMRIK